MKSVIQPVPPNNTLDSGINVGPTFINFGFFPGPKGQMKNVFMKSSIFQNTTEKI
jgi:hypothetical protein